MHKMIGFLYKKTLKPILFKFDPELVHDHFTKAGHLLSRYSATRKVTKAIFSYQDERLVQTIAGIRFPNPVGLSAGFDKDANLLQILPSLGFGFMQVGSVTLKAYEGNPKPRLYRLPKSKGIVVYYGLKNTGVEKIIQKIKGFGRIKFPYSVSIAKTNDSCTVELLDGINDYFGSLDKLVREGVGDMYTINISCPNTFGGEPFTTPDKLDALLSKLKSIETKKPIYVKMPINLAWEDFNELLKVIVKHKLNGVIIGNLQKDYKDSSIKDSIPENIKGGISGKPTWELSNDLIAKTYKEYQGKLTIIGVGGIFSSEDAYEKIKLGANLVQLITGMIYEGPQLIGEINKGLVELLEKDGLNNISEAVGMYHKD